jgi:hypothetical protein
MRFSASLPQTTVACGERQQGLESLFRAIVSHPSASILIADPEQGGERQEAGSDLNPSVVPIAVFNGI